MSNIGETFGKIVRRRSRKPEASKTPLENQPSKIYLKAMPLRNLSDLDTIKREINSGNILIVKISPLANKSLEDIKNAVDSLCEFTKTVNGDIARLGDERIVVTPSGVRIWRERVAPSEEPVPTAA